ncbi:MAG: BTAD domain-containing putative transcriptional regulator, partial [Anaerolineae bacterium]
MRLDDVPVTGLNKKALAIVYYLATTRQTHSREVLAGLLWSDYTEQRARGNLRVELGKLRPILGDFLIIERRSVTLDFDQPIALDVAHFEVNLNQPDPSPEQMETAVSHYHGDFLADFSVRGAVLFEEWVLAQRERLRQMQQDALTKLTRSYTDQGAYERGITAARQLLAIEPWLEGAHRQLMLLLALDGQRAAALAQYDNCCQILMTELGVNPSPETDKLYDQIEAGKHDPGTAHSPRPLIPFQPSPQISHFVGRDAIIAALRQQLTQPNGPHIMALVGMGGVGKSTLANQMAHTLRDDFPDGVLWADAVAGEPLDILNSWGKAYGYDFSGLADLKNRAAAVRGLLAEKKTLVVLDDVVGLARIRPLIPSGSGCAVLVTTRNLDVATALNAHEILLGELSAEDGVKLLATMLGAARIAAEPEAAAEICALLQNLPLAVEIIGQRLRSRRRRKLADMANRLRAIEQRLGLEISDRVVRASFEVSWDALDGRSRRIFALLGVFGGRPFTAPALAHVADLNVYDAEDYLYSLTALSLLREDGAEQFRQHALLADFAREKLEGSETAVDPHNAYHRMAVYYQNFAAAHKTDYAALQPEWLNLLAGMRVGHAQENWPLVLAYGQTLIDPWFAQARFADIQTGMAWVNDAAKALDDEPALAYMEMKWGQASIERNEYETAVAHLEKSLSRFRTLDDQARIAEIQFNPARIAIEHNEYEHALNLLHESKQIRQFLSDQNGIAAVLYREARVWAVFGPDIKKAVALAHEALAIQRKTRDIYWQINSLRLLTEIEIKRFNLSMAEQYCREAYELSQK